MWVAVVTENPSEGILILSSHHLTTGFRFSNRQGRSLTRTGGESRQGLFVGAESVPTLRVRQRQPARETRQPTIFLAASIASQWSLKKVKEP